MATKRKLGGRMVRKKELMNRFAEDFGYLKKDSREACDNLFKHIRNILLEGNGITIDGFGTFTVRFRKGYDAVDPNDPKNPEKLRPVPSYCTVGFKPSKAFRDEMTERLVRKEGAGDAEEER